MPGEHHAGHAGALGAPEQGPQVVRIGDAVQHQQERDPPPGVRFAQRLERRLLDRPGQGHHPLGGIGAGQGVDAPPADVVDPDPAGGRQVLDLVEDLGRIHALGHEHGSNRPPVGAEQFPHRLTTLDLVATEARGPRAPAPVATSARAPAGCTPARGGAGRLRPAPAGPGAAPDPPRPCPDARPPALCRCPRPAPPRPAVRPVPTPAPALRPRGHQRRTVARRPAGGQQHDGGAGDPLGPAQGPQPLGPGGLHVDRRTEHRGQPFRHLVHERGQPGTLGHHRAVGVDRRPSGLTGQVHHPGQDVQAVGPLPRRVGVGGVAAEVAEPGRPEHGVGDGVGHGVGVAVALEGPGPLPGDDHPAQDQRAGRVVAEPVDVESLADPDRPPGPGSPVGPLTGRSRQQGLGQGQVLGPGQLHVVGIALHRRAP